MERSLSSLVLSWLLAPVAAVLVQSALSLPRQPYTGLILSGDWVAGVIPGSPGERAGIAVNDRLHELAPDSRRHRDPGGPLGDVAPGRPLSLNRVRGGEQRTVWLVPDPLPDGERRLMAAFLAVASGFVLLGGWVWSERRDPLSRTLFLLCLAFAWLLAPLPHWSSRTIALLYQMILSGITVFLPALFVHFFAIFPESRARGRNSGWVKAAYGLATFLYLAALALLGYQIASSHPLTIVSDMFQAAAAIWFAAGFLVALTLFVASYRRAGSTDARRRLRVALIGTLLGAGPLAALIALRNLSPGTAVPGERWAVTLTLLVPASFAWATVVHRIFDFRVALRAIGVILILGLAGAATYAIGEWLAATWWPDVGTGIAGGALAFVALASSLAGPAAPWLGSLGARVVPGDGDGSLAIWTASDRILAEALPASVDIVTADSAAERLLAHACEAVMRSLRLDACLALKIGPGGSRAVIRPRESAGKATGPELGLPLSQLGGVGVQSIDETLLERDERDALESAGIRWILPVGSTPIPAVLLLGRRLAGGWLGRREVLELERFAEDLAMRLENLALRHEASSHGLLARELKEARAIQVHLLPRRAPVYATLDCAAAALCCEPVGGDYYDFVDGPGKAFTLAVGDAAGKGVPAALLLAQVQARFRTHADEGLSPGQLLNLLNQELVGLEQPEKFVGLLCARVDVRNAKVTFANAGLTPPLVRRRHGAFEEILTGGVLLGVSPEASYPDVTLVLRAGDLVVIYTDGLTEARRGEELFGTDRVREVVTQTGDRRAADVLEALLGEVRAFADHPLDDLTVLILRQLTDPVSLRQGALHNALKWQTATADLSE